MLLELLEKVQSNLDFLLSLTLFVLRCYRLLCYTTYTFDMFPIVNPYNWPFSFINTLTRPYFRFIKKFFKAVYLGGIIRFDISPIIAFFLLETVYKNLLFVQTICSKTL